MVTNDVEPNDVDCEKCDVENLGDECSGCQEEQVDEQEQSDSIL